MLNLHQSERHRLRDLAMDGRHELEALRQKLGGAVGGLEEGRGAGWVVGGVCGVLAGLAVGMQ